MLIFWMTAGYLQSADLINLNITHYNLSVWLSLEEKELFVYI